MNLFLWFVLLCLFCKSSQVSTYSSFLNLSHGGAVLHSFSMTSYGFFALRRRGIYLLNWFGNPRWYDLSSSCFPSFRHDRDKCKECGRAQTKCNDCSGHVGNKGGAEVLGGYGIKERNPDVQHLLWNMEMGVEGARRCQMVVCRMALRKKQAKAEARIKWWTLQKDKCCSEFREEAQDDWENTSPVQIPKYSSTRSILGLEYFYCRAAPHSGIVGNLCYCPAD